MKFPLKKAGRKLLWGTKDKDDSRVRVRIHVRVTMSRIILKLG